jgi:hypothetical protein
MIKPLCMNQVISLRHHPEVSTEAGAVSLGRRGIITAPRFYVVDNYYNTLHFVDDYQ